MKRSLLCLFFVFTCTVVFCQQDCRQQDYQQSLYRQFPFLQAQHQQIENFSQKHILPFNHYGNTGVFPPQAPMPPVVPEKIVIPVVVHIVWNTAGQNISDAQVLSQIAVLNKDFSGQNSDRYKIPAYFSGLAADCGISFALARTDPQGHASSGIVHRQTTTTVFGFDDKVKSNASGGDDAWNADDYLNIWVCNLVSGISGYASAPGGPAARDGIVIGTDVFGILNRTGPFSGGRTAVHETGHWLNLRHIWGDASCGDDQVDDTPTQQGPNRGCNSGEHLTCGSTAHGDMYMNFMDFSDDACMYMFTNGQRSRMRVLFEAGGPRNSLLHSNGLAGDGLPQQLPLPSIPGYDMIVYPNPASSTLTLQLNDGTLSLGQKIYICNQLGQIVKIMTIVSKLQQIDISTLYPGLYFIKMQGMQTSSMKKFIKQ